MGEEVIKCYTPVYIHTYGWSPGKVTPLSDSVTRCDSFFLLLLTIGIDSLQIIAVSANADNGKISFVQGTQF